MEKGQCRERRRDSVEGVKRKVGIRGESREEEERRGKKIKRQQI
jgi:hypothetical protein